MSWHMDEQYEEHLISEVTDGHNGWELKFDGCWVIICPSDLCAVRPKVGQRVRLFGRGIGFDVRGIVVDGRVYRYRTEAEADAEHERLREERLHRLEAELEEGRAERDAKVAAMPKLFRDRIERFQRTKPDWRRDHEAYEIFCCQEAVKIAVHLLAKPAEDPFVAAERFARSEELQKEVLGNTLQEHSGNTFSAACKLALVFVTKPENVVRQHGALCGMVGCEEYGCWAAYKDEEKT